MPDTLVHIKGILDDELRDTLTPRFVSSKFVVRWAASDELKKAITFAMNEIWQMNGMVTIKDERKPPSDFNNRRFIPMRRIWYIDLEVKNLNGQYPEDGEGPTQ